MKKLIALVLALVMVLAVAAASAASITINRDSSAESGTTSGTVFTYYEIMKADLSALQGTDYESNGAPKSNAKVVYYVTKSALATALGALTTGDPATPIFRVTQVTGATSRWNVELVATSITGAALATALDVDAVKNNAEATGTFTMTGTSVTKDDLDAGYYLVKASNGTVLAAQTLAAVTINEKNDYPTVDKKISAENGTAITATTADEINIGDTVTYSVPVVVPANVASKDIVVHDKMYYGLTLNASSLANDKSITGLSIVDDDTVAQADRVEHYNYYKIVIPAADVVLKAGQTITLTYTATLNANAIIGSTGNTNTVKLTYDNYTSNEHTVTSKTYKVEVKKVVGNTETRLSGVGFTLTRTNGSTTEYYVTKSGTTSVWTTTETVFTTDASNNIVFDGIDAGTYTLTEKITPPGYNPLSGPITVVVATDGSVTYTSSDPHNTASNATATGGVIQIGNYQGTTLPSTGGIGTTIFYILGGLLVVGAAVILVARRKAHD